MDPGLGLPRVWGRMFATAEGASSKQRVSSGGIGRPWAGCCLVQSGSDTSPHPGQPWQIPAADRDPEVEQGHQMKQEARTWIQRLEVPPALFTQHQTALVTLPPERRGPSHLGRVCAHACACMYLHGPQPGGGSGAQAAVTPPLADRGRRPTGLCPLRPQSSCPQTPPWDTAGGTVTAGHSEPLSVSVRTLSSKRRGQAGRTFRAQGTAWAMVGEAAHCARSGTRGRGAWGRACQGDSQGQGPSPGCPLPRLSPPQSLLLAQGLAHVGLPVSTPNEKTEGCSQEFEVRGLCHHWPQCGAPGAVPSIPSLGPDRGSSGAQGSSGGGAAPHLVRWAAGTAGVWTLNGVAVLPAVLRAAPSASGQCPSCMGAVPGPGSPEVLSPEPDSPTQASLGALLHLPLTCSVVPSWSP